MTRMIPRFRILLLAAALLVVGFATAQAQGGIDLSWNDCGSFGVGNKSFTCASNTLTGAILFASAVAPVPMNQLVGQESEIILQTNTATLSPWWHLESGGCRGTTAVASGFDFTSGPFSCLDPWSGQAAGGMNYEPNYGAPNRARLRTVCAIPGSTAITDSDEYYFFKVTLLGAKTVGNNSCAGCTDGVCIVLNSIKLVQVAGVGDYVVTNPIVRQHVTWQGGMFFFCPAGDPVQNRTWGSVKSMYR